MTTLRPLDKPVVNLAQVKPAGKPPKLDFLPLSQLRIDDSYQRTIERKGLATIVTICNAFDWNRFAPLIVARVPGKEVLYAIIDGQHRATAALLRGYDKVPCAIVEATAAEQPAIFSSLNGTVTPITIFQLFKAARAGKSEWALEIDSVCQAAGLVPLLYPKPKSVIKPFETMAIGTLRRSIMRFGVAQVTEALKQATKQPDAAEPGYWTATAVDYAIAEFRTQSGKRQQVEKPADELPMAQRIRNLKKKGYTRFAIQSATGAKLAVIEEALRGGT